MFLFIKAFCSPRSLESNLSDYITSLWTGEPRGIPGPARQGPRQPEPVCTRQAGEGRLTDGGQVQPRVQITRQVVRQVQGQAGKPACRSRSGPSSAGYMIRPGWFPTVLSGASLHCSQGEGGCPGLQHLSAGPEPQQPSLQEGGCSLMHL